MSDAGLVSPLPSSVDAYRRHGWRLIAIPPNTKGPRAAGWNAPDAPQDIPPGYGLGLAHAYSGTMALDIDDWDTASAYLAQGNIDLRALYDAPDAVIIDSGRQGHGKLLYALPLPLPSKKILAGSRVFLEFRCGTANGLTVQDVLPPSVHPDTRQPYRWAGAGNWMRLPPIPDALLSVWTALLEQERVRVIPTGDPLPTSWEEIRSALTVLDPNCGREEWIHIGMALHWAGAHTQRVADAFELWDEWSRGSADKYPGEREMNTQWRSMRADRLNPLTLGTLFHYARCAGWKRASIDASSLFKALEGPLSPAILLGEERAAPGLDLGAWPKPLARMAEAIAYTVGCDPIVAIAAGLGAACGVADARTRLHIMNDFYVPPVLWLMTVGRPSDKKSPGSRPMMDVLTALETADRPRFAQAMLEWEGHEAAYGTAKKAYLQAAAAPEALLPGATLPGVPQLPPQPVPLRLKVQDITSQKLVRYAADRPQGLLLELDEMHAWIHKVTDMRSGEDRSAWVAGYEARPYSLDRVGTGSTHCSNYALSIYGNLQPDVLKKYLGLMTSDGLVQRFIPFTLRREYRRDPQLAQDIGARTEWEGALRLIHAIGPQSYRLSPGAFEAYRAFQQWYRQRLTDEEMLGAAGQYLTALGKIEGTAGRLMLVWHLIESPFAAEVSGDLAERALRTVRDYIVPSLDHVLNDIGGLNVNPFEEWVRDYVVQCSGETDTLTLSQIRRSARRPLEGIQQWTAETMINDAMAPLEAARWVMRIEDQPQRHHIVWAINPSIAKCFADFRNDRIMARQRLMDQRTGISRRIAGPQVKRQIVRGYDPDTMDD